MPDAPNLHPGSELVRASDHPRHELWTSSSRSGGTVPPITPDEVSGTVNLWGSPEPGDGGLRRGTPAGGPTTGPDGYQLADPCVDRRRPGAGVPGEQSCRGHRNLSRSTPPGTQEGTGRCGRSLPVHPHRSRGGDSRQGGPVWRPIRRRSPRALSARRRPGSGSAPCRADPAGP